MKTPFTSQELLDMLLENDFNANAIAARRIWTDWSNLSEKETLQPAGEILLGSLRSTEDERYTWHCMLSLGCLNYHKAIPTVLSKLQNSSSDNIRGFAAEALGKFKPENIDEKIVKILLEKSKEDPSIVVRVNALRALQNKFKQTKDDTIALALLEMVQSEKDAMIRSVLIETIGEIGSLKPVPELMHIMITRRVELVKDAAAKALDGIARLHDLKDRQELIEMIKTKYNDEG